MTQQELKQRLEFINSQLANEAKKGTLCVTLNQGGSARELEHWLRVQEANDIQDQIEDMYKVSRLPRKYNPK